MDEIYHLSNLSVSYMAISFMCKKISQKIFNAQHDLTLGDIRVQMGKILFSFLSSFPISINYFGA